MSGIDSLIHASSPQAHCQGKVSGMITILEDCCFNQNTKHNEANNDENASLMTFAQRRRVYLRRAISKSRVKNM